MEKDYKISSARYYELKYFCLQYHDFKAKIKENELSGGSKASYFQNGMSSGISNPTMDKVLQQNIYFEYCELIEQTALIIGGDYGLYQAFLDNVTIGLSYEHLRALEKIPDHENGKPVIGYVKFYNLRRKFYYLLNFKKI